MDYVGSNVANALSGRRRQEDKGYAVTGVNVHGEDFTTTVPRTRENARELAAEINANGGDARVIRLPAEEPITLPGGEEAT